MEFVALLMISIGVTMLLFGIVSAFALAKACNPVAYWSDSLAGENEHEPTEWWEQVANDFEHGERWKDQTL